MKKLANAHPVAPVDLSQRYTIREARVYLRISHASIYKEINARRLRVLKHGKRTFIPGSEIARLSRLEDAANASAPPEPSTPAKPEISANTSYRLLDSRIHQALMKDIARQQALWDAIEKFDGKLEHLTRLVEKLAQNTARPTNREADVAHPPTREFLRLKDITARIGLGKTAIYQYMACGAFPKARKVGHAALWVTTEVNEWIAKRTAGVPIEIDGREAT